MEFEKRKAAAMAAISDPNPDKSPKGNLDAPIVPLIDAINLHPSFFTTSSCSGRISILHHPATPPPTTGNEDKKIGKKKKKKKAGGGGWILVSHDPVEPESVVELLFKKGGESCSGGVNSGRSKGSLVFRFEPLIIAIECRDTAAAQLLVSLAISSGFRESGITSVDKRIMMSIRCSIRLEVPLGDIDGMMVSPDYIRYLVAIANQKLKSNRERTDVFFHNLQRQLLLPQSQVDVLTVDHHQQSNLGD